mgnify:FL=1
MDNQRNYLRYIGYGLLIMLMYLIQFTPLMFPIFGQYPMPLLMSVIIISMFENDLTAGIIGLICGMLTDINTVNGSGLHAILYMFTAVAISLLIETLLQNNVLSLVCVSSITLFINSVVEILTKSKITSGFLSLYSSTFLISAIISFVLIIPYYLIFALLFGHRLIYKRPSGVIHSKLKQYRPKKQKVARKKDY